MYTRGCYRTPKLPDTPLYCRTHHIQDTQLLDTNYTGHTLLDTQLYRSHNCTGHTIVQDTQLLDTQLYKSHNYWTHNYKGNTIIKNKQ